MKSRSEGHTRYMKKKKEKMTNLKTLKDLVAKDMALGEFTVSEGDLKAEVIKWVKFFGIEPETFRLRQFFNITSEDLK